MLIEKKPASVTSLLAHARDHALRQIDRTLAAVGDSFPHYTEGDTWIITEDGGWTGGMWVGQLWRAYEWTAESLYRDAALKLLPKLAQRIDRPDANFDLGFLLFPSFVRGFEILRDDALKDIPLRGATRMLDFFHEKSGVFYTVYPGSAVGSCIIDIMMNLSLLWWASKETHNPTYYETAKRHAERTAELHIRADGSTFHVVEFDRENGKVLKRGTIHGHSDDSTWARGQAWALHGFAMAYLATQDLTFYEISESLSDYFFNRLPADGRSYWDFSDPAIPNAVRDTSATAIAATAWLGMRSHWPVRGERLVETLAATSCTDTESPGILTWATAYKAQGRGVHGSTVWGDYFLLEGFARLKAAGARGQSCSTLRRERS